LKHYQRLRRKHFPACPSTALFLTGTGHPISYHRAGKIFRSLRNQLGWNQSPLPRLHDLRHTFAVRRLIAWQRRGANTVGRNILALATYLGHRNIRHTYWYLSAVPELLAIASQRLGRSHRQEGGR
jgi:integrase